MTKDIKNIIYYFKNLYYQRLHLCYYSIKVNAIYTFIREKNMIWNKYIFPDWDITFKPIYYKSSIDKKYIDMLEIKLSLPILFLTTHFTYLDYLYYVNSIQYNKVLLFKWKHFINCGALNDIKENEEENSPIGVNSEFIFKVK